MRLKISSKNQRQRRRAHRSPFSRCRNQTAEECYRCVQQRSKACCWNHSRRSACMLRWSSAAAMEESLMMSLSPSLMSILLSHQSHQMLSCRGGQLTVGTGLKINFPSVKWTWKSLTRGQNKTDQWNQGRFLQSWEGNRNNLHSKPAVAVYLFTHKSKQCLLIGSGSCFLELLDTSWML